MQFNHVCCDPNSSRPSATTDSAKTPSLALPIPFTKLQETTYHHVQLSLNFNLNLPCISISFKQCVHASLKFTTRTLASAKWLLALPSTIYHLNYNVSPDIKKASSLLLNAVFAFASSS